MEIRSKCNVTGFSGIVVARTEYLAGNIRLAIQSAGRTSDGAVVPEEWADENLVTVLECGTIKPGTVIGPGATGRREHPSHQMDGPAYAATDQLCEGTRRAIDPAYDALPQKAVAPEVSAS